jgi:RNA polymerase sigma-70 factor (ECF subfamily)
METKASDRAYRDVETSLIERAKEGEGRAFDLLVRENRPLIARRVRCLCRNDADVEDIVQEVMITMYRKLDHFRGESALSTWLYRIATNAFLMYERRKRRDKLTFIEGEPYEDESSFEGHRYEGTDGFRYVYERELLDSVSEAMETLPARYRQVLLMRRRDGLSLKEVSRLANITVASVKSRQYRANKMLKEGIRLAALKN